MLHMLEDIEVWNVVSPCKINKFRGKDAIVKNKLLSIFMKQRYAMIAGFKKIK